MAVLRSDLTNPIFGTAEELPINVLPTYEDVMKCYLFHASDLTENKKQLKGLVGDTAEKVSSKIEELWEKASIPVIDHRSIVRRIRGYHDKYRMLLKPYKTRKLTQTYINSLEKFKMESKRLFDIAACRCDISKVCNCEKSRKVPLCEREFIQDQRSERKMCIGGLDRKSTKKNLKLIDRKLKRQEYEEKASTSKESSFVPHQQASFHYHQSDSSINEDSCEEYKEPENNLSYSEDVTEVGSTSRNFQKYPTLAITLDRYGVSDRAGAAIVSAALQDMGVITENNTSQVVDRSKLRRAREKQRTELKSSAMGCRFQNNFGLYFDGRKDKTLTMVDSRRRTVTEEHISLIKEPGSEYIGHVSLQSSHAVNIRHTLLQFFVTNSIDLSQLIVIGCDGTITNTGRKGGVIRLLEVELKRPLQWFVCQLHGNELPLRHLLEHIDGTTAGPHAFSGPIGKALMKCEELPVVNYQPIESNLPEIPIADLSTDQQYLLKICQAVISGNCSDSVAKLQPGKMVHSRWLTVGNRILRLYISSENPSDNLVTLATFVVKVYAPMWFYIKQDSSCFSGANHLWRTITLSRYLPTELKRIIDPVIQRNAYFGHCENILISMLADHRHSIRELGARRILKARKQSSQSVHKNFVREFTVPKINFLANDYVELIDWQTSVITEPPLTKNMAEEDIFNLKNIEGGLSTVKPEYAKFPCHTQAVERCVKLVTEASLAVCDSSSRDGFIRARIESRKSMPSFNTKREFSSKIP